MKVWFSDLCIVNLEKKIDELYKIMVSLRIEVDYLKEANTALKKENSNLLKKVDSLERKLYKKNSSNSSIPPSKDENRVKPNQSLREKTGKKSGGQKGHAGTTLKMQNKVDKVVDHKANYCLCCREQLLGEQFLFGRRQVIDIPPIQPIVTEHRIFKTVCSCGTTNSANYPESVASPISYGSSLTAAVGYLSVGQYMSMQRIVELFGQMFHIKLSQGTIGNMMEKLTKQCIPMYNEIKTRIEGSAVVGSDETGCVVNGKKWWMWVWQNNLLTYIAASKSRGYQAITDNFPNGLLDSILLSDCWAAQLKTPVLLNQLCILHIQRELKYFIESCKSRWSRKFLNLIYKALSLKKSIVDNPNINYIHVVEKIKETSTNLLALKVKGPQKLQALKNRLTKYSDAIWVFLDYKDVTPDNNGSERAIRNVKVKQKVSGQFRSENGARQFAIIRSVYDTARKNNNKAFDAFTLIANSIPE